MKTFWKVLGFAALAAGLTPYRIDKDEETGERSYQALLWSGSSKRDENSGLDIHINLDEGTLTSKVKDAVERKKEDHLFSDELSVDYNGGDEDEISDAEAVVAEAEAEAVETEAAVAEDEVVTAETEAAVAEEEAEATETETVAAESEAEAAEAEDAAAE